MAIDSDPPVDGGVVVVVVVDVVVVVVEVVVVVVLVVVVGAIVVVVGVGFLECFFDDVTARVVVVRRVLGRARACTAAAVLSFGMLDPESVELRLSTTLARTATIKTGTPTTNTVPVRLQE
jgi:hypothetical protein